MLFLKKTTMPTPVPLRIQNHELNIMENKAESNKFSFPNIDNLFYKKVPDAGQKWESTDDDELSRLS